LPKVDDNIIRVSSKPVGNYLTAIAIKLKKFSNKGVYLTAFGKNLDLAFAIAEKAKNFFDLDIFKVETIESKDERNVVHRGISILLKKQLKH